MKANPNGAKGEDYAALALKNMGYIIRKRNFSSRFGEIDIIAEKDGIIAFIEVKTRRSGAMVTGAEAVTPAKRRKIILTARWYMHTNAKSCDLQPRFDIFSVTTENGKITSHIYLEGAFDEDG